MSTRSLFDNIMQWVRSTNRPISTTVLSEELDFDLSRGFVAKFRIIGLSASPISFADADNALLLVESALLRDPDDTSTVNAELDFQNDLMYGDTFSWFNVITTTGQTILAAQRSSIVFTELMDMVSARNLRHNSVAGNSNGSIDNIFNVGYTLETIDSVFVMDLLDIL